MSKGLKDKVDINKIEPSPRTNEETLHVWLTDEEKKYLSKMAQIMSKLKVNETNSTLIPDKTLASLGKMALNFLANIYCTKVFTQSEIAANLPDKQALNEFIAFRKKYMNFPVDKQIADLKRVGIVK